MSHLFDVKLDKASYRLIENILEKHGYFQLKNHLKFHEYNTVLGLYDNNSINTRGFSYFNCVMYPKLTVCEVLSQYALLTFDVLQTGDIVEVVSCDANDNLVGDILFITPEFKLEKISGKQGAIILRSDDDLDNSFSVAKSLLEISLFRKVKNNAFI